MKKSDRKYLYFLGAVLVGVLTVQALEPKPIDWSPNFTRQGQMPYGSALLYRLLPEVFPGASITPVRQSIYEVLRRTPEPNLNYLFVNLTFAPDATSVETLLDRVARGQTVFIAAETLEGPLADSLHLKTDVDLAISMAIPMEELPATTRLHLTRPVAAPSAFLYRRGTVGRYFARFDTARTQVLGYMQDQDGPRKVNFIRISWGVGAFYLHTAPRAFTNYNLVTDDNARYTFAALSHLPVQATLWDGHYKISRQGQQTPLRYILSVPALRWAYGLTVVGMLLFVGFRARRRQRIIPVIEPLQNTTLAFARTVGRLYHQRGDHQDLAQKKIRYFLDYLRTHLQVDTRTLDDALARTVAQRAGLDEPRMVALFQAIAAVEKHPRLTPDALIDLHTQIDAFYAHTQR